VLHLPESSIPAGRRLHVNNRTFYLALSAILLAGTAGCSGAQAADDAPATKAAPTLNASAPRSTTYTRVLQTGAVLDLRNSVRITSETNHVGDAVSASFASAALTSRGDTVIPVGSTLSGSITAIQESGSPSEPGRLELAFGTLTIGSRNYPVQVSVTNMQSHLDKAGVTTGDAAKVAAGAVVGGIAGRLIGKNQTGTLVGAGAGAAAGAVYAHQTRNRAIVLLDGVPIGAVLSAPFTRSFTSRN
jgi:hypothetical protein